MKRLGHVLSGALLVVSLLACQSGGYAPSDWSACTAPDSDSHPASAQASRIIESALAEDRGAGISAAVSLGGEIVWQDTVGRANAKHSLTPITRMRIGSVSKPLTAAIATRLHDLGVLDVEAPVQDYVEEFPHQTITVGDLAQHRSGLRQYDFSSLTDANNRLQHASLTDAFARHVNEPLEHRPRERFHYSSIGYNLLGLAIERAYGRSYDVALADLITEPMGLAGTGTDNPAVASDCRADFYSVFFGRFRFKTIWRNNSDLYPSGGLLSTAGDLARFADTALASSFFSEKTKALFTAQPTTREGTVTPYSFGWEIERSSSGRIVWIGHGGTINGAYASLRHYPCSRLTVAAIANYNFAFTNKRPRFFHAVREELPALFGHAGCEET